MTCSLPPPLIRSQVIDLSLELPATPTPSAGTTTPVDATPTPFFRVGDTLSARTGIIVDHNGHPVPDGTGVQFKIAVNGNGGVVQQIDSATTQGVAKASFSIDRPGLLEISAASDPAISSVVLQLNVTSEGSSVTIVTPTPIPEFTPTPTMIIPTPTATLPPAPVEEHPGFSNWLLMVILLCAGGYSAYWFGDKIRCHTLGSAMGDLCCVGGLDGIYVSCNPSAGYKCLSSPEWLVGNFRGGVAGGRGRVRQRLCLVPPG